MTGGNLETQGGGLQPLTKSPPLSLFKKRTRLSCDVAEPAAFPVVGAGVQSWALCSWALSLTGLSAVQWGHKGRGLRGGSWLPVP